MFSFCLFLCLWIRTWELQTETCFIYAAEQAEYMEETFVAIRKELFKMGVQGHVSSTL